MPDCLGRSYMRKLSILAMGAVSAASFAQTTYGPGPGFLVPDGPASNTLGPAVTSDIVVGSGLAIASFNSVTITGLTHSWQGDLLFTLTHLSTGTTVDLMDRVGRTTTTGS